VTTQASIRAIRVTLDLGGERILNGVDAALNASERVGLVGPNGVGKSSLLATLSGTLKPTGGRVQITPPTANVGFLGQEPERRATESVRAYLGRRTGVDAAKKAFERASQGVADDVDGASDEYASALERWVHLGGADFDARVETVWRSLGLDTRFLEQRMRDLSGGEVARAGLAVLRLSRFDLYLLDEPTNNLDIEGLEALEEWMLSTEAGQLIVSHDREFLRRTVTRVVEIDAQTRTAASYVGGWETYVAERAQRERHAAERYNEYIGERVRLEEAARRERAWAERGVRRASRGRGDRDKWRRNASRERSERAAGKASRATRALERLEPAEKPWQEWELHLEIRAANRSGSVVVSLTGGIARQGSFTLGPVDLEIGWGERVALLGPNGSGKTTLLRTLLGSIPLQSGERTVGPSVVLGSIDQARGTFEGAETLLDVFLALTTISVADARSVLAKFGLGAQDVERSTSSLSPGERTRASLALLQVLQANFLVLDEPTNHLDLPAIEQLEEALATYDGTLLVVTHDRQLLRSLELTRVVRLRAGKVASDAPATRHELDSARMR
jgi:ATPase subunit of ABC transporter with duplicated ATPase domains